MKTRYIIMAIAAILLLSGCKKEVDFHGYEGERHVVVMAQMEPDSLVCVNLSYTKFFLDNGLPEVINNAEMKLWVNDVEYSPMSTVTDGNYWFNVHPIVGDSLRMYANVPGEGELRAQSVMIGKPKVSNVVSFHSKNMSFIHMMDVYYLRFQIQDNGEIDDNYRIEVLCHDEREAHAGDPAIDTIRKEMFLYTRLRELTDTVEPKLSDGMPASDLFISDENWNGETKQTTFIASTMVDTADLMKHTYFIRISDYSSEMKKYKYSMMQSDGNMFVEPQRVYTNIEGGLGVFASKSETIYKAIFIDNESIDNR